MQIQKQIEEAITKHRKILAEATTFDEMAIRTEKLIREALNAIATKSANQAVLDYILSLGWQDTENEYVKEVLNDAEKLAEALSQKDSQ